jgi:hypothetical protein
MRLLFLVMMVGLILLSQGCCCIMLENQRIGERTERLCPIEMCRKEKDNERIVIFSSDRWSKKGEPLQYRIVPLTMQQKSQYWVWTIDFSSGIPDNTANCSTHQDVDVYVKKNQFVVEEITKHDGEIRSLLNPKCFATNATIPYTTTWGHVSKALYVPAVAVDIVTSPLQIILFAYAVGTNAFDGM